MKTKHHILAERIGKSLTSIRQVRRMRQSDLAKNLGIPASQLCKLEKGVSMPSLNTFLKIANELGVTASDLLSVEQPVENNSVKNFSSEDYLKSSFEESSLLCVCEGVAEELSARSRAKLFRKMYDYKGLEADCGVCKCATIPLKLPFNISDADAEALAQHVRNICGIGSAIVLDYIDVLGNNGFHIFIEDIPKELASISFYDEDADNVFIFVSKNVNPEKQVFRIFYEIGMVYLFTRGDMVPVSPTYVHKHFANTFAANFLLPRVMVLTTIARLNISSTLWTLDLISRIKLRFSVSAEAFTLRLLDLQVIDKNLGQDILSQIRAHYRKTDYEEPGGSRIDLIPDARIKDLEVIRDLRWGIMDE